MDRRSFTKRLGGVTALGLGGARSGRASGEITVHERVEIESWDGTTLVASLYVPAGTHDAPRPAIVAAHADGVTRETFDGTARTLAGQGYVVLAPDARGFGDSGGESSTNGPREVAPPQTGHLARNSSVRDTRRGHPPIGDTQRGAVLGLVDAIGLPVVHVETLTV